MAWTPRVKSSCANVRARFGKSGNATSPSAPYSVSMTGSPGPAQVTAARSSTSPNGIAREDVGLRHSLFGQEVLGHFDIVRS